MVKFHRGFFFLHPGVNSQKYPIFGCNIFCTKIIKLQFLKVILVLTMKLLMSHYKMLIFIKLFLSLQSCENI